MEATIVSPFPLHVANVLVESGVSADTATPEQLFDLADNPRFTQRLAPYLRFVRAFWSHATMVERYFPAENMNRAEGAKDFNCKQNSALEMLSVGHQIYVLKSYGVGGHFAEFGCFKGFSSSMLSYACSLIDVPMLIFDSFEGLPKSDSDYYQAGDFAGSLEEVRRNIETFGAPASVRFHKGFFSDSLKLVDVPPLMGLFMDVDLSSSARDVMAVSGKIDPRGTVFSHECVPEMFVDGAIEPGSEQHSVAVPIVRAISEMGAEPTGRFVSGNTGAFWRRDGGIPVLPHDVLVGIAAAC